MFRRSLGFKANANLSKRENSPFKQDFISSNDFLNSILIFITGKDLANLSGVCFYFKKKICEDKDSLHYQIYVNAKSAAKINQEFFLLKNLMFKVNNYFWDLYCLEPFGILHLNNSTSEKINEIEDNAKIIDRASSFVRAKQQHDKDEEELFAINCFSRKQFAKQKVKQEKLTELTTLLVEITTHTTHTKSHARLFNKSLTSIDILRENEEKKSEVCMIRPANIANI